MTKLQLIEVTESAAIDRHIRKADNTARLLAPHIEEIDENDAVGQESLLATLAEAKNTLEIISSYLQGLKQGGMLS